MGWKLEELPRYLEQSKQKKEDQSLELALQLKAIENDIDCVGPQYALQQLRKIPISDDDPRQALIHFLKGKAHYKKENWEKAQLHYQQAIRLCNRFPELEQTNIQSASYNGLGQIAFRQNDPFQALASVERGLASFKPDGERRSLRFHLLISKVIYLEKLERYAEAIVTLEEDMWSFLEEIDSEVQLNMYELHATLLNKQNLPDKAISSAYNYTELGLLHMMEGNMDLAEENLQKAVMYSKKAKDDFRQYEALFALGKLYLKQQKEKEAIPFFEMAREIAESHGLLRQERDAVVQLIQCYESQNVFKYQKFSARLFQISVQLLNRRDEQMTQDVMGFRLKTAGDPPDM